MKFEQKDLEIFTQMFGEKRINYIVPGLDSTKLDLNMVRVFEMSREQEFFITPHNHRFDFTCFVLAGAVTNTVYKSSHGHDKGDLYQLAEYTQDDKKVELIGLPVRYSATVSRYGTGNAYSMSADQFHSIEFSKGAKVLFLEGKPKSEKSRVLLPAGSDGKACNTLNIASWMFKQNCETTPL